MSQMLQPFQPQHISRSDLQSSLVAGLITSMNREPDALTADDIRDLVQTQMQSIRATNAPELTRASANIVESISRVHTSDLSETTKTRLQTGLLNMHDAITGQSTQD